MITFASNTNDVDWEQLKIDLIRDDFHNGRTTGQLRLSFENSSFVAIGFDGKHCIANGRMLSDGVGNAMIVDVWTHSKYRRQGVATKVMQILVANAPGQHIYLQSDDAVDFYIKLGFQKQPEGLSVISGKYLENTTRNL